ncbi:MAG TPA: enoyl-CoA hydratase/isomerase family protein [Pyrinomonadaceae bacterium]|jgi:methylglutaconyl-CoA hydratase|nr:enoyl-CoA hydratase/isomerase family protein [Pyrinomonadaceae bacterium]
MSNVIITTEDLVRFITLNRPEKRNALNDELIGELKSALREADSSHDLRAIVIRGAGSDFCSGADLSALQKISESSTIENLADAENLMELFLLMRKVQIPVIAAVHGRALAGGCGLATACDLVLATKSARFGYPEVKIGFVPAMVAAILRRNLSEKRTFELITQGFEFSADQALEMGLINRVFADESFESEVNEYVSVYSKVSRSAVMLSKKLMYSIDGKDITASMRFGAEINTIARQTEDCKKGIAKFLKK